jgi:hypothetical protein
MFDEIKGDLENSIKKITKYVVSRTNNAWLRSIPEIVINGVVEEKGKFKIDASAKSFPIQLGTPKGNAIFKFWMEKVVIPKLKSKQTTNKII